MSFRKISLAVACAVLLPCTTARAQDPWEIWPELNLYKSLGPTTRLYFVAAYAKGKEAQVTTLDLAGYFDLTLPGLRQRLGGESLRTQQDWRQKRYVWVRLGYDHIFKQEEGERTTPEDRGIVAVHGRVYLPAGILFEARTRADLRWIGGDYSTRYRFRGELNRDFDVLQHVANVYLQAEYFYDTRYDGWAIQLYQVGTEVTLGRHFRVEPSVARRIDMLPETSRLWALAFVARWFY